MYLTMTQFLRLFFLSLFTFLLSVSPVVRSGDGESLLALKASLDPLNVLPWGKQNGNGEDVCKWQGVKECLRGRVSKLVVEKSNLSGTVDEKSLNQLDQLRVLSLKENLISGKIPSLSGLGNLKSLYLNGNNFSGQIPESLSKLHRLKVIVLSENSLSGEIPVWFVNLPRLYVLYLQDNQLKGVIPGFKQTSLRFLNVSNNQLNGEIPATNALSKFNESSFGGNIGLCGEPIRKPCPPNHPIVFDVPSMSPSYPSKGGHKMHRYYFILIGVGGLFLALSLFVVCMVCFVRGRRRRRKNNIMKTKELTNQGREVSGDANNNNNNNNNDGKQGGGGGYSWDNNERGGGGGGEGVGKLVFLGAGDQHMTYSLEDLLKASAETLGRGTMGSTYKAMMESGYIVTVKRLRDARYQRLEEFRRHVEILGRLTHPNLVPFRAYFQANEERLLVFDYFPNGSLFSLIHGSRASGGSKPLHWTSCLKIAEDLATGLVYIHQNPGLTHGNLKSCNVLLGPDFESCLTDYGLVAVRNPDSLEEPSASSVFYRAPECRDIRRLPTQAADVYSFGVLLLELLTGKTPFQDLVQEHGSDIPRWVRSVREEETESGEDPASSNEGSEEKLTALLNIAMACVSLIPENRPAMKDVLRMIREARAEAHMSSNSSDHSPGRWSDTVQSLPRDEHLSI